MSVVGGPLLSDREAGLTAWSVWAESWKRGGGRRRGGRKEREEREGDRKGSKGKYKRGR